jgi:hypothetical protein
MTAELPFSFSKELSLRVNSWLDQGKDNTEIEKLLIREGFAEGDLTPILKGINTIRLERRRKRGLVFLATGAVLLVGGFLSTMALYHTDGESMHYVMYGVTSLGIVGLFMGMIDCLGW